MKNQQKWGGGVLINKTIKSFNLWIKFLSKFKTRQNTISIMRSDDINENESQCK